MDDYIFHKITKPARYTGAEWNTIVKDWDKARVKVALAFPDIYEVGMSNMAIPILYDQLNSMSEVLAERVYAPWPDMENQLRVSNSALYSLETRHPINQFDIVGFSIGYELSYTTVLNMLDLSGIPVLSRERKQGCPLIIAGGSCTMNPEPMSDFMDAFFIGEAENSLVDIINIWQKNNKDRDELLRQLCRVQGIYIPRFYSPQYDTNGVISSFKANDSCAPEIIRRVFTTELKPVVKPVIPYIEIIHDRAAVEIQRGCSRGCRFCQAGMLYRPIREMPEEKVLNTVDCLLQNTGYNTLSLISLSSGDYSNINHLVGSIASKYADKGITISLPSLRLDRSSIDLIESLPSRRKTTLTFAPEAGSERMRRAINKWIPEDTMMDTFAAAFQKEWMNLKLYFMIGLPTETMDDVAAIANLIDSISKLGKYMRGRPPKLRVSISSFVPKPHTPCQWSAQDNEVVLLEKHNLLQSKLRRGNVQLSWNDPKISRLEAVLARGDRRLCPVIYTAWKKGCRLDTWSELFDFNKWQQAFSECDIDPSFYAHRERSMEEILPWQHISSCVAASYLTKERQKMHSGTLTPDCRTEDCNLCGLQGIYPECGERAKKHQELL